LAKWVTRGSIGDRGDDRDWSESRVFQLLTHAITPLPAYADLERTRRADGFDAAKHECVGLAAAALVENLPCTN
jgi:hypothetical protein